MKKLIFSLTLLFGCLAAATAQIVNIPDANFKNALVNGICVDTDGDTIGDISVDSDNDGEIQVAEALAVIRLYIGSKNITDLTGVKWCLSVIVSPAS